MKIAVDAMGGDNAPGVIVEGSVLAAREFKIPILLIGDEAQVNKELSRHLVKGSPEADLIEVRHASETVGMDESPSQAVRKKKDSSMRLCFEAVKRKEASAVVSAGNSGAAMASGIFLLKRIKGVERPAIAVSVPTMKDPAVLLDVGGNVDCRPQHLLQFAAMGEIYARYAFNKKNPRVGLLSNAEEEAKGNDLTRETNALIRSTPIKNYLGYVEGRDIFHGDVDVVVTDGFVGNVALKLSEGLVEAVVDMLKIEIKSSFMAKIGYLLARGAFKKLKKRMDYSEYGGALLLGIDGICIISHGGSNVKAIKNAINKAAKYSESELNRHLEEDLATLGVDKKKNEIKPDLKRVK